GPPRSSSPCRGTAGGPRRRSASCRTARRPASSRSSSIASRGPARRRLVARRAQGRAGVWRTERRDMAHPADSHDVIRVQGARENILKDVSLVLPKRRLTVFTGVSGSGKSSVVFDTIAAESQRMINETYSAFVQGFMPTLARPDVDLLE